MNNFDNTQYTRRSDIKNAYKGTAAKLLKKVLVAFNLNSLADINDNIDAIERFVAPLIATLPPHIAEVIDYMVIDELCIRIEKSNWLGDFESDSRGVGI